MKKIGIVMGSDSDLPVVKKATDVLNEFGVPFEAHVFSAHRTPEQARDFALHARENGFGAIICAAGMAAHLAGFLAANTWLPVIGIRENALGENIQHLHISTGSQSVTVDEALFRHLPLLKTLTLPARFRIKRFPACLLACAQLESVTVQADNADGFHTENGVLYQKNALIFYPPAKKDVSFTIPETATSLKESAFNHARFTTLTFNKSSTFECDWETLFAALPQLESIRVYPGSSADLVGAQYFSGEIVYYE